MNFLSVCSGIEAASVAWHPMGWNAVAYSEIDPFPCAVLAHHYPSVPNWGDMTKFKDWPDADVDLLVGGTPCQSFSVAGLRKGLDDPRGNLMLTFGAIADRYRPEWLVWENVPGVLSSNGGRDFGSFLWLLGELGYGFAYRVHDAQYFGLAQRRKRVFVVGCLGDWRRAAAVLFERHSLSGHPAPRRETRQRVTGSIVARAARNGGASNQDVDGGQLVAFGGNNTSGSIDVAAGLNAKGGSGRMDFESETFIAHSLRGEGFDASDTCSIDGCGGKRHAGGFCTSHYSRFKRHGDPLAGRVNEGAPSAFLDAHVTHAGNDCVIWPYARLASGYGSVQSEGKTARAHRVMCQLAHGVPADRSFDAAHSCGTRLCINPRHLRWATRTENMADAITHGTTTRGEKHGAHRLTEDDVREIMARLADGETHESIALGFDVARTTVTDISKGKNWSWLTDGTGRDTPLVPVVAPCLTGNYGKQPDNSDTAAGPMLIPVAFAIQAGATRENPTSGPDGVGVQAGIAYTVEARAEVQAVAFDARQSDVIQYGDMSGPLDTDGHSVAVAFQSNANANDGIGRDISPTLRTGTGGKHGNPVAVAFAQNQRDEVRQMDVAGALAAEPGAKQQTYAKVGMQVRRLTPREAARLQGFEDTYLDITYRGKPAADGNKYKALGNSMAVPVIRWIGERIDMVSAIRAAA
ncbi:MAG: DNA (cytosine-5-)-methyltransferase [Gammaproteobacteria bacterium]